MFCSHAQPGDDIFPKGIAAGLVLVAILPSTYALPLTVERSFVTDLPTEPLVTPALLKVIDSVIEISLDKIRLQKPCPGR
jgi:hypothetical protein